MFYWHKNCSYSINMNYLEITMEIMFGVIAYLVVLAGFMLFGRFLHDCDKTLEHQFNKRSQIDS